MGMVRMSKNKKGEEQDGLRGGGGGRVLINSPILIVLGNLMKLHDIYFKCETVTLRSAGEKKTEDEGQEEENENVEEDAGRTIKEKTKKQLT